MSSLLKVLVAGAAGIALGLWLTFVAVDRGFGFGAVQAGPWTFQPRAGAPDADPYARATYARSGEIPLGIANGLTFFGKVDSKGAPLDPSCEYKVAGPLPVARFWSLSIMRPDGRPVVAPSGRSGFTSSELVRDAAGDFTIVLARSARPGNWLQLPPDGRFVVMLRLYDTAAGATISSVDQRSVPRIEKGACA